MNLIYTLYKNLKEELQREEENQEGLRIDHNPDKMRLCYSQAI